MRVVVQKSKPGRLEAVAAALCFLAGMLAGTCGTVVATIGWILGGELHPWLRTAGTVLLVVTIPLLILAGYCLDWMEAKTKTGLKKVSG